MRFRKTITFFLSIVIVFLVSFVTMSASFRYDKPEFNNVNVAKVNGIWKKDNNGKFIVTSQDVALIDGWYYICDNNLFKKYNWYYFDEKGERKSGWVVDRKNNDIWYYINDVSDFGSGGLVTGWLTDPQDGKKYYLDPETGNMCFGWKMIGPNWYYFGERLYADVTWTKDANGNWIPGKGIHSFGTMYCDEMTPDGHYVGKNGEYEKSSGSSSGGSSGGSYRPSGGYVEPISARAITTTTQYYGKEFNPDGLIITVYKYGVRYKVIKLPDASITIRKISVNGKENGLLRSEQNKIDVEFVYYDTDVIIGQTMKTTLNVLTTDIDYSSSDYWYSSEYGEDKIDVFYILWTVTFNSTDDTGKEVYYATLSDAQKKVFDGAFDYTKTIMFTPDKFNIIAPYYRQLTMASFSKQMEITEELPVLKIVLKDVFDAFDYYMEHKNNGRPFIVAGFSQGGLLTPYVINHMTEEQYSRLIAGYSMGFQVTSKQLSNPRIKAAEGEDDLGVVISYNSVENLEAIWPAVGGKSATCINPLNWKTDTTSAELETEFLDKGTVYIDKSKNVLLVKGLDNVKYGGQNYDGTIYPMPPGNYHMWEMRFYAKQIKDNALLRTKKYKDTHP